MKSQSFTDHNYLILNPNLNGLLTSIKHKIEGRPELGRILNDKVYDERQVQKHEVALWAHVKVEKQIKEQARLNEELKRKATFASYKR
jgi:hypothetical protein